jgi:hypothetical protein
LLALSVNSDYGTVHRGFCTVQLREREPGWIPPIEWASIKLGSSKRVATYCAPMDNLCAGETETAIHLSDERYCRERARLFRNTAEQMANTASRRLLLDLAEECDDSKRSVKAPG